MMELILCQDVCAKHYPNCPCECHSIICMLDGPIKDLGKKSSNVSNETEKEERV
jgi:hypothetical protein